MSECKLQIFHFLLKNENKQSVEHIFRSKMMQGYNCFHILMNSYGGSLLSKFELTCTCTETSFLFMTQLCTNSLPALVVILFTWSYKLILFIFYFYYFEDSFIELCNYFIYNKFAFLLGIYSFYIYLHTYDAFIETSLYIYITFTYIMLHIFLFVTHLSHIFIYLQIL